MALFGAHIRIRTIVELTRVRSLVVAERWGRNDPQCRELSIRDNSDRDFM